MKSQVITIGNSKGIRLSKDILALSGIVKEIELTVKRGEIKIKPVKPTATLRDFGAASDASFAKDWLRPEEDEAWSVYQSAR